MQLVGACLASCLCFYTKTKLNANCVKFSQILCFQSYVLTWGADMRKIPQIVELVSGVCVFLGIFVFLPGCVFNSPRLSDKIPWTSFRTFGKFCISWTLLTVLRPTYFCKFVFYCPIKFWGKWSGLDWPCFPPGSSQLYIFTQPQSPGWTQSKSCKVEGRLAHVDHC